MKEKIILAGGSGFLGSCIIQKYFGTETEIVVLTRHNRSNNNKNVSYRKWDGKTLRTWTQELEGGKAVINLTGKSVNCRYTEKNKREIISSRVDSTLILGEAIRRCTNPPDVWINAGSAAIFGNSGSEFKDEDSQVGEGFSPEVCKKWEQAFRQVETPQTRKVLLRIGIVLQPGTGILKPFINMAKVGLGGRIGTGEQYMTWIHEHDFVNLIAWIISNRNISGIIHAASPSPVANKDFMKAVRDSIGINIGLPNPEFLVKIGAPIIGTEAELVLSGRRVISKVLPENGFRFKYPELNQALTKLNN